MSFAWNPIVAIETAWLVYKLNLKSSYIAKIDILNNASHYFKQIPPQMSEDLYWQQSKWKLETKSLNTYQLQGDNLILSERAKGIKVQRLY